MRSRTSHGHPRNERQDRWRPADSGLYYGQPRSYAGKGPKNYKRSDERIQEEIYEILTWNPDVDATDVEVIVKDGDVTLSGSVIERRMKRLTEELIEDISGVRDVANQLKVKREEHHEQHEQHREEEPSSSASAAPRSGRKSH